MIIHPLIVEEPTSADLALDPTFIMNLASHITEKYCDNRRNRHDAYASYRIHNNDEYQIFCQGLTHLAMVPDREVASFFSQAVTHLPAWIRIALWERSQRMQAEAEVQRLRKLLDHKQGMMLQLNPPLPLMTPKGPGFAHVLIDPSPEHHLQWVVFIDETGECWTYQNCDVRIRDNITLNRCTVKREQSGQSR